jgi:hypothetical protein
LNPENNFHSKKMGIKATKLLLSPARLADQKQANILPLCSHCLRANSTNAT